MKTIAFSLLCAGILLMFEAAIALKSPSNSITRQYGKKNTPEKDNIDSLMHAIRKDTVYHIVGILYDHIDSNLFITITGEAADIGYFDNTYHISRFQSIDGIRILSIHNRELASNSKRGDRLMAAFRNKWCDQNECIPLTTRIRQTLRTPQSYSSKKLFIDWVGDSSFIVTNIFQSKGADGLTHLGNVQAQIDFSGRILVYNVKNNK